MYSYIKNVFWLPQPNCVELHFSVEIPDLEKVAAVFVYAFDAEGKLLMAQEHKGTWDVPGGGRDTCETIEDTAKRETLEETCVRIKDVQVVGFQKLLVQGDKPEKYKRPYPEAYEVFVVASIDEDLEFKKSDEMVDRNYFTREEAEKEDGLQFENRHVIFEKAYDVFSK